MLITLRGGIAAFIRTLRGRSKIKPRQAGETPGKWGQARKEEVPKAREPERPADVKNPLLKGMMKKIKKKEAGKPQGKSRFSGLAKRLRGIRIPRPKLPKIRKPAKSKPEKPEKKPGISKPKPPAKPEKPPREKELLPREKPPKPRASEEKKEEMLPSPKEEPAEAKAPEEIKEIPLRKEKAERPEKKEEIKEKPETGESCQICGKTSGLQTHYIVPLNKGGKKGEENAILLCGTHKKQAEEGMYSENLLKNLKGS